MRTRSLFTVLACTAVLAGASAETAAFADSSPTPSTPSTPSHPPATETAAPGALPTPVPSHVSNVATPVPSTSGHQITAVPSGAPNTGVPSPKSDGHGEAEALGASLLVLLGGSGSVVARRKLKGRG